jgi:hypothetical protein
MALMSGTLPLTGMAPRPVQIRPRIPATAATALAVRSGTGLEYSSTIASLDAGLRRALAELARTPRLLVACDYDGTLAPGRGRSAGHSSRLPRPGVSRVRSRPRPVRAVP